MWLTNATYIDAAGALRHGDIAVDDGRIAEIAPTAGGRAEAVDCSDHLLVPGLVNAHFHSQSTLLRGIGPGVPADHWDEDDTPLGRLRLRVFDRLDTEAEPEALAALVRKEYLDQLRQGVTFIADSGVSERTAAADLTAVLDELGLRGSAEQYGADETGAPARPDRQRHSRSLPAEEDLTADALAAVRRHDAPGTVLTGHCLETPTRRARALADWGRSSVAVLDDHGLLRPGTVLFHGSHADAADLARIAEAGAALVHCPVSNLLLGGGTARTGEWLDAGARTALGTDWADTDLWRAARAALLGLAAQGRHGAELPARVLRMATRDGALAYGRDDLGEIAAGRAADLVLLDADALGPIAEAEGTSTAAHAVLNGGRERAVRHVMVGGRWVLRAGEPVHADARAVDRTYAMLAETLLR